MTLTRADLEEVAEAFAAVPTEAARALLRPRYNVAPTDPHLFVRAGGEGRVLDAGRWGWPGPQPGKLVINGRAETLASKALFRRALQRGRCVVVADGFFEWRTVGGRRLPLWFHPADGGFLRMAGLFEPLVARDESPPWRFTVMTTAANELVRPIHDRMPALLASDDQVSAWLSETRTDRALDLLHPAGPQLLVATPVSARVNSVAFDDPRCLHPEEPRHQPGFQARLFD
jgi:putative SOS response-associated peptidase YedK